MSELHKAYARMAFRTIECTLVGMIEEIEGRVPSDDEVRRYGCKLIFTQDPEQWTHYTWKGEPLFRVRLMPFVLEVYWR